MTSDSIEGKQVRVGIVGGTCIGKTCMVKRFVSNSFHGSQYIPTPGVDFFARRLSLKTVGTVTFIITDIGSSAINSKMLPIYLHGIDIFLLAYDMTNASSLTELRKWITIITAYRGNNNYEPSVALVGCKGDLEHLRSVRLDVHTRFAQEYNISLSFLTSAKSGESVVTCFTKCGIYHLSPEAKQRVREHAIMQASLRPTKRTSVSHPILVPQPGKHGQGAPSAPAASGAAAGAKPDPDSTVCAVQ